MAMDLSTMDGLALWRRVLVRALRDKRPDLSQRQMSLLLTVYLTSGPHTVRGLAEALAISKPAVTRALDRLAGLDFLRRKTDETDRRNVLVQRTVKGSVFLSDFAKVIAAAATSPESRRE
jgi:DNA-binding MarR family transcriptional regulator